MSLTLAAGRGVTQVVERCESAKETQVLDLSNCQLMYIADAVYMLLKGYDIDKINIRGNCMKKFPKKFVAKFPTATILNMESNEIAEIPEEVATWKSLKGINAANNGFEKFPEAFLQLDNLIYLNLKGNRISDLDVDNLISSLPNLIQLDLSENPLTESLKSLLLSKKPPKLVINI